MALRVQKEARILARLLAPTGEPHLVLADEVGEIDGWRYLRMPFVDGIDLDTMLDRGGPPSPARAVHIVGQIAAALDAAHTTDAVLRDVSPGKILVTRDDVAYLVGQSSVSGTDSEASGEVIGRRFYDYLAPECFATPDVEAPANRYSLACILYACLTGAPPFPGTIEQQVTGHLTKDPPKPSAANPLVPKAFDEVVARGMAKDPHSRYPSAAELAAAAAAALSATPAVDSPIGDRPQTRQSQSTDCVACGRSVVEGTQAGSGEHICMDCRQRGLPRELVRRLVGGHGGAVTIAGYTLLNQVSGGSGPAFRARSQHTGEVCALRVVPRAAVAPEELAKPRPFGDLAGFRHANAVTPRAALPVGEFLLVVTEYWPGETIEQLVLRLGSLTVRQAVSLVLPCLDALTYAHGFPRIDGSVGIMHRNITPTKFVLTWSGGEPVTKLVDFGFATEVSVDPSFTPRPQVTEPARAPARDVDTWQMAACLYYMLTGTPPRVAAVGKDPADVVMSTMPVPIRRIDRNIPRPVAAVIDEALIDAPHIGIQDAGHLTLALRKAVFGRHG